MSTIRTDIEELRRLEAKSDATDTPQDWDTFKVAAAIHCRRLIAQVERMAEALDEIAESCEQHPCFIPDATDDDIEREGGDAAMFRWNARLAREALAAMDKEE